MNAPARPCALLIGTSAGGVEALLRLLPALPADFAAAVLVVLHRPARSDDGLAALLGAHCKLPVEDAWDHQPIVAGRVLLAPPDYHMLVDPGPVVALSADPPVLHCRPAIDPLFESAAAVYGRCVLALVLTGANQDGSSGAVAVRRAGGRLWVQSEQDAVAPSMPAGALAAAGADAVISLAQMAHRLPAPGLWDKLQ